MIRILPLELDRPMFCLYDDATLLAKCCYSRETGEIYGIEAIREAETKPLRAALLKAVMSSLEYAGITEAWSRDERLFPVLKALRFQPRADGSMWVSLVGYFTSACECH